jgi:DNA-binding response OmpR family regulator
MSQEMTLAANASAITGRCILLIENDPEIPLEIREELNRRGYLVSHELTVSAGVAKVQMKSFELLIVNRTLAEIDGLSIIERLRQDDPSVPVLDIRALGKVNEPVSGFEAGADDYLTKPFRLVETGARVEALLQRLSEARTIALQAGPILIDMLRRSTETRLSSYHAYSSLWNILSVGQIRFNLQHADRQGLEKPVLSKNKCH